ncbi:uncharacterized protein K444DRAFT_380012 [Hyaloscypha bicolor E]|uniref:Uncharacterized protein n=1 Tax=Hyaloscypha bicolor E TaxID=1095630 RepID=A0A2J6TFT6_9HELO|nr:uncharacterized protein K444DRAFT_380012 [Hyaloscypha bicolor E]PMD61808.1 hypothetical protein K444DRAFT_380012 [Hyaloscypha bicolor E]
MDEVGQQEEIDRLLREDQLSLSLLQVSLISLVALDSSPNLPTPAHTHTAEIDSNMTTETTHLPSIPSFSASAQHSMMSGTHPSAGDFRALADSDSQKPNISPNPSTFCIPWPSQLLTQTLHAPSPPPSHQTAYPYPYPYPYPYLPSPPLSASSQGSRTPEDPQVLRNRILPSPSPSSRDRDLPPARHDSRHPLSTSNAGPTTLPPHPSSASKWSKDTCHCSLHFHFAPTTATNTTTATTTAASTSTAKPTPTPARLLLPAPCLEPGMSISADTQRALVCT